MPSDVAPRLPKILGAGPGSGLGGSGVGRRSIGQVLDTKPGKASAGIHGKFGNEKRKKLIPESI